MPQSRELINSQNHFFSGAHFDRIAVYCELCTNIVEPILISIINELPRRLRGAKYLKVVFLMIKLN